MIQAILIAQQIGSFFKCSRRKASEMRVSLNEASVLRANSCSKDGKSSDSRSNDSTDLEVDSAAASTSGSEETDSIASSTSRNMNPPGLPPGLPAPPGLELPYGGHCRKKYGHFATSQVGDFSVKRQAFVPNFVGKNHTKGIDKITASEVDMPSSLEEILKRRVERERSAASKDALHQSSEKWNLEQLLTYLSSEDSAGGKMKCESKEASRNAVEPHAPRFPSAANLTDGNTMRSNLQKLATIDSKRVFMVKKISKLGLNSSEMLKRHFSKFGVVEHVFVTHSVVKTAQSGLNNSVDQEDPQENRQRLRPACSGFIVMEKADDVVKIFKEGLEPTISGVSIFVATYERSRPLDGVSHDECKFGLPPSSEAASKPCKQPHNFTCAHTSEGNTLRSNLRKLIEVDESRIFMVRRIGKLGLDSAKLLKTYFGRFGDVTKVLVSHSVDKRSKGPQNASPKPRIRAACIGFVIMDKAEDVAAVFQTGLEQVVYGVSVSLVAYQRQTSEEATPGDNEYVIAATEEEPNH
jgi:hypothetical protein